MGCFFYLRIIQVLTRIRGGFHYKNSNIILLRIIWTIQSIYYMNSVFEYYFRIKFLTPN